MRFIIRLLIILVLAVAIGFPAVIFAGAVGGPSLAAAPEFNFKLLEEGLGLQVKALTAVFSLYFLVCFLPLFLPLTLISWVIVGRMKTAVDQ